MAIGSETLLIIVVGSVFVLFSLILITYFLVSWMNYSTRKLKEEKKRCARDLEKARVKDLGYSTKRLNPYLMMTSRVDFVSDQVTNKMNRLTKKPKKMGQVRRIINNGKE